MWYIQFFSLDQNLCVLIQISQKCASMGELTLSQRWLQVIIWIKGGLVYSRIYVSRGINALSLAQFHFPTVLSNVWHD